MSAVQGQGDRTPTIFLIAGEESGDQLGGALMAALRERLGGRVRFAGVGGARMAANGLDSLFPITETAIVGFSAVFARLPQLLARIRQAADAAVEANPDVLVIIDSPDFTHRVARRVRQRAPGIPIVDYVSPSVWAWRPGRARRMRAYVDHVLAILPFEPAVHQRLGGPPCTYVGHPLLEKRHVLRPRPGERPALARGVRPTLLVLPGSRRAEVERLSVCFGNALDRIARARPDFEVVIPAVEHLAEEIRSRVRSWRNNPKVVVGEEEKLAAFRRAHAALAASGTVTLELALAHVPMAVAYRIELPVGLLRLFVDAPSIVLPNLVLGERAIPEFINSEATPEALATAVAPLLGDTPTRTRQVAALERIDGLMAIDGAPSDLAAGIVLKLARLAARA
jgi:lipid-A-disaccharide synthase